MTRSTSLSEPARRTDAPPPAEPRRPVDRATAYAGLLHVAEYADDAMAAMRAGDDDAVIHGLAVLSAIVAVVTGKLLGSSSQYLSEALQ
jgi:hypothetical protein